MANSTIKAWRKGRVYTDQVAIKPPLYKTAFFKYFVSYNLNDKKIMSTAKKGKTVKVHYTGTLDDGTVFDSSLARDPLEFTVGGGMVIAGFDDAVDGLAVGEYRTVHIPAAKAYGPHYPENVFAVPRDQFPPHMHPEVGQKMQIPHPQAGMITVTVSQMTDLEVTLDANHDLAGKDLNFTVQLIEIL